MMGSGSSLGGIERMVGSGSSLLVGGISSTGAIERISFPAKVSGRLQSKSTGFTTRPDSTKL